MAISTTNHNFNRSLRKGNPNYICIIEKAQKPGEDSYLQVVGFLPSEFSFGISSSYATPYAQAISENVPPALSQAASVMGVQLVTQALTAQVWQGSSPLEMSLELHFHVEDDPVTDVIEPVLNLQRLVVPHVEPGGGFFHSPGPSLDPEKLKEILKSGINAAVTAVGNATSNPKETLKAGYNAVSNAFSQNPGKDSKGSLPTQGNTTNSDEAVDFLVDGAAAVAKAADGAAGKIDQLILGAVRNNITISIGRFMRFSSVVITAVTPSFKTSPLNDGSMSYATVTVNFQTFLTPTEADLVQMYLRGQSTQQGRYSKGRAAVVNQSSSTQPATKQTLVDSSSR